MTEAAINFERGRQVLLRQMLPHTCIGHPIAAALSCIGLRGAADWVHYWTLPSRARRRLKRADVQFTHNPRLFWLDTFWTPIASVPQAFGGYDTAARFFALGPWETAREFGACAYYRYSSGGVNRTTPNMTYWDIAWFITQREHRALWDAIVKGLGNPETPHTPIDTANLLKRAGPEVRAEIQAFLERRER